MRYLGPLFIMVLGFLSCETQDSSPSEKPRDLIFFRVNFNENIHSLNPLEAETSSEFFIRELVFSPLFYYQGDSIMSDVFSEHYFDPLKGKHVFRVKDSLFSHSGKRIFLSDIFLSLSHAFEHLDLYDSMKVSQDQIDSLMTSELHVSSQLDHKSLVNSIIRSKAFLMDKDGEGTGPFIVVENDDDISYKLKRIRDTTSHSIDIVEVRFIKNDEEILKNFVQGELDLIMLNRVSSDVAADFLKREDTKYPKFSFVKSNKCQLLYARTNSIGDSLGENEKVIPAVRLASSRSGIQNSEQIIEIDDFSGLDKLNSNLTNIQIGGKNLALVSVNPYYYVTNFEVTNVDDYMGLSDLIKVAKIKSPQTY